MRALDGRELEVSASAAPLRDHEGRVVGAVSAARDVTWRKQLEREQVAALRVAAPSRTIRLHAPATGKPIPVEVDADRIGQVVTNYLTNALKYASPDWPVDVTVEARRQRRRQGRQGREGRARG